MILILSLCSSLSLCIWILFYTIKNRCTYTCMIVDTIKHRCTHTHTQSIFQLTRGQKQTLARPFNSFYSSTNRGRYNLPWTLTAQLCTPCLVTHIWYLFILYIIHRMSIIDFPLRAISKSSDFCDNPVREFPQTSIKWTVSSGELIYYTSKIIGLYEQPTHVGTMTHMTSVNVGHQACQQCCKTAVLRDRVETIFMPRYRPLFTFKNTG